MTPSLREHVLDNTNCFRTPDPPPTPPPPPAVTQPLAAVAQPLIAVTTVGIPNKGDILMWDAGLPPGRLAEVDRDQKDGMGRSDDIPLNFCRYV